MIALGYDSDRKFLLVGGALVALVWSLLFFQPDMRNITHLWGFDAVSGFLAAHDLRWYQSYCLFLAALVLRPSGEWRFYYGTLFAAFLLVALPVAMFNDSLNPDKPRTVAAGKTALPGGAPIYGANGTRWATIVQAMSTDLNLQSKVFDQDMRMVGFPEKLDAGVILSDPQAATVRLRLLHNLVERHRAEFAKIVTRADAALQAEQKNAPSPLLQMYQKRARQDGERIDADLVFTEKIASEFDAVHRDLTHPVGKIESKGDSLYFTSEEDRKIWVRHRNRLERLFRQRKEARNKPQTP